MEEEKQEARHKKSGGGRSRGRVEVREEGGDKERCMREEVETVEEE